LFTNVRSPSTIVGHHRARRDLVPVGERAAENDHQDEEQRKPSVLPPHASKLVLMGFMIRVLSGWNYELAGPEAMSLTKISGSSINVLTTTES
jgi:hypothetical protein